MTKIKHASLFAWQVQHMVKFECHFLWQVQHLVRLKRHCSWQVQLSEVEVSFSWRAAIGKVQVRLFACHKFKCHISWQVQREVKFKCHFSWQTQHDQKTKEKRVALGCLATGSYNYLMCECNMLL